VKAGLAQGALFCQHVDDVECNRTYAQEHMSRPIVTFLPLQTQIACVQFLHACMFGKSRHVLHRHPVAVAVGMV